MRLLARREHSQKELAQKLTLRGFQAEEISVAIAECINKNWQDDQRYTESFVRQRIGNGYGPLRIRYDLQQRGISKVDIDAFADEFAEGWQQLLLNVYHGKFTSETVLTQKEWLKRCRFLAQRGFPQHMINGLRTELKLKINLK